MKKHFLTLFFRKKLALMQTTSFDRFPFFSLYLNFFVCFYVFAHIQIYCTEGANIFFSVTEEVILSKPPCFIQVCFGALWWSIQ